jgi:hypothetical protein
MQSTSTARPPSGSGSSTLAPPLLPRHVQPTDMALRRAQRNQNCPDAATIVCDQKPHRKPPQISGTRFSHGSQATSPTHRTRRSPALIQDYRPHGGRRSGCGEVLGESTRTCRRGGPGRTAAGAGAGRRLHYPDRGRPIADAPLAQHVTLVSNPRTWQASEATCCDLGRAGDPRDTKPA